MQELAICSRLFADLLDEFVYQESFFEKIDQDFYAQMSQRMCVFFHMLSTFLKEVAREVVFPESDDSD